MEYPNKFSHRYRIEPQLGSAACYHWVMSIYAFMVHAVAEVMSGSELVMPLMKTFIRMTELNTCSRAYSGLITCWNIRL